MIRAVADIEAVAAPFLAGLNACFREWGDRRAFEWCFLRQVGAPAADLLVAERDEALIAGSAVTYRRLRRGDGREEQVGCMTGSWTLPEARGQGIFGAMIDASLTAARARSCRLLVGYGAMANGSYRPLVARSAAVIDAAFLTSPGPSSEERMPAMAEPVSADVATEVFARRRFDPEVGRLIYRPADWRGQMLERPRPTDALRLASGDVVILERRPEVDRLLDVSTVDKDRSIAAVEAAANLSHAAGRRLSTYSVEPDMIAALVARGYSVTPACFYLLLTGDESLTEERWWFANGDRM